MLRLNATKIGWRSWLLTTLAGRIRPKIDAVLATGAPRAMARRPNS
jgi:hypothetical protein